MKDFVYLPPMWWYVYGIGAYMAIMNRLVASARPVLNEDKEQ